MSIQHKKPPHRRNGSEDELDVFEAARYFSGYNDNHVGREERQQQQGYNIRGGRVSLDMPSSLKHHFLHQYNHHHNPITSSAHHHNQPQQQQKQAKQERESKEDSSKKQHKQPSSPGGKLALFLNSLFNQASSKKKKKPSSTQSMRDGGGDESPGGGGGGRRRRRSSISHFRSTSSTATAIDGRSLYSSSSSGFRTPPPPYTLSTPTKGYSRELRGFTDHKEVLATLSKYRNNNSSNGTNGGCKPIGDVGRREKERGCNELNWVDENFDFRNGFVGKQRGVEQGCPEKKRQVDDDDDGAESDSSSDLFELQIDYGFGFCSSGLPVYETTRMDSIKRSSATAITNGPIKNCSFFSFYYYFYY